MNPMVKRFGRFLDDTFQGFRNIADFLARVVQTVRELIRTGMDRTPLPGWCDKVIALPPFDRLRRAMELRRLDRDEELHRLLLNVPGLADTAAAFGRDLDQRRSSLR